MRSLQFLRRRSKNVLDVEANKKNRVFAAQFASYEAIASTPHSSRLNNSISENGIVVKDKLSFDDKCYMLAAEAGDTGAAQRVSDEQRKKDAGEWTLSDELKKQFLYTTDWKIYSVQQLK